MEHQRCDSPDSGSAESFADGESGNGDVAQSALPIYVGFAPEYDADRLTESEWSAFMSLP